MRLEMNLKKLCVSICLAATPMMAQAQTANIDELIAAAKQEGTVNSVGMPLIPGRTGRTRGQT